MIHAQQMVKYDEMLEKIWPALFRSMLLMSQAGVPNFAPFTYLPGQSLLFSTKFLSTFLMTSDDIFSRELGIFHQPAAVFHFG